MLRVKSKASIQKIRHAFDLDIKAEELGADRGAGGCGLSKIAGIDPVHFLEVFQSEIGEINARADDILKSRTGCREDFFDVLKDEFSLPRDGSAFDFSCCGIPWRHAGDEDESALRHHAERVGAQSWRTAGNIA